MEQPLTHLQQAPARSSGLVLGDVVLRLLKYLVEGLAVAAVAWMITYKNKKLAGTEVFMLGVTAGATFAILDLFSPAVGSGVRQGAGFGMGFGLVGASPVMMPGVPPVAL